MWFSEMNQKSNVGYKRQKDCKSQGSCMNTGQQRLSGCRELAHVNLQQLWHHGQDPHELIKQRPRMEAGKGVLGWP